MWRQRAAAWKGSKDLPVSAVRLASPSSAPQGVPGIDGEDGSQIEVIQLCDGTAGNDGFTEYLLRIDGDLFGVYAQGQRIFLARLTPGAYRTTDGRNCPFLINADGSVQ